jgi:DNA polymerase-3 subunit epsilon
MTWEKYPLRAISIETTGGDEETARIVAIGLVFIGDTVPLDNVSLLIDPGVPIPAEATARHGITTEQARAEGTAPAEALQTIRNRIEGAWSDGHPLIGFDIIRTLTLLDREMRRHLRTGLAVTGPVIDPHVIDLALNRRDGPRSLAETCRYYQVRQGRAHDPVEDALAAARLAWKLARRHPDEVRRKRLPELHRQQINWAQRHADHSWPLRPNSTVDPRWNPAVLDAIHDKIRTDWEAKLRADGPQPFRTELHIVNDTRAAHSYFTSIRCLPHNIGHNDAFPIALMGALAQSMAADRVVIAWEPGSLQLATWSPGTPLPEAGRTYTLQLLDVVVGTATRLCRHPYIRPTRDGSTSFSWGATEVIDHPTEPLHPVIAEMISFWRGSNRGLGAEFWWRYSFRRMDYDITDAPSPTLTKQLSDRQLS